MPAKKSTEKKSDVYAVIETGGKQYGIVSGDSIKIERLQDKKVGDTVVFDKVLLVDDGSATTIGTPYIDGASVKGKIVSEGRSAKVLVVKYKPKSRYMKRNGHRQSFMKVAIESIK
jgi:large subunit ribosomal protein L21